MAGSEGVEKLDEWQNDETIDPAFFIQIGFGQANAQAGLPSDQRKIDRRIFKCPNCGLPGCNTMWGAWHFMCGAEIDPGGEVVEPCPSALSETNK